jgi:hypothetical protein
MKNAIRNTFVPWKKSLGEAGKHWRITMRPREIGEDATYPQQTGIRVWLIDGSKHPPL